MSQAESKQDQIWSQGSDFSGSIWCMGHNAPRWRGCVQAGHSICRRGHSGCWAKDQLLKSNDWKDPGGPSGGPNKQKAVNELFMQGRSKNGNRCRKIVTLPLHAPLSIPVSLSLTLCLLRPMAHVLWWDSLEVSLPSPTSHPFSQDETGRTHTKILHLPRGTSKLHV